MWISRLVHSLLYCSLVVLPGCFSYVPIPVAAVPPGAVARARLSGEEAERIQAVIPIAGRLVQGTVVTGGDAVLLLEVPTAAAPMAGSGEVLRQRIQLPVDQIVELELRQLDRWRTGGLVAVGAVAIGVVVARQFSGGTASSNLPPGGGGPSEVVIPIRLPLGFRFGWH